MLSLPDDLQRVDVDLNILPTFSPKECDPALPVAPIIKNVLELIRDASRPVFIFGNGLRLANAGKTALDIAAQLGIPIAPTWAVMDLLDVHNDLMTGTFGTHGTRHGNFAVQNADLVISLGARLDSRATGSPPSSFARAAKKVVVDIDWPELEKFSRLDVGIDLLVQQDVLEFVDALYAAIHRPDFASPDFRVWNEQIRYWQLRYPICPDSFYEEENTNPSFCKAVFPL